jgi:hypothetical protein
VKEEDFKEIIELLEDFSASIVVPEPPPLKLE